MEFGNYPVRFLKVISIAGNELLVTGQGGTLLILDTRPPFRVICSQKVFLSNYIYGVEINSTANSLCVYGQRFFRILHLNTGNQDEILRLSENSPVVNAGDWIWDVEWLGDSKLALLLGHNQVRFYSSVDLVPVRSVQCEECCLLYSGIFVSASDNASTTSNLFPAVISGTIFNEVLVWFPLESTAKVVHRLRGHQGVVFNVSYDWQHSHHLFSTSDDRSCRVWRFVAPDGSALIPGCPPNRQQWLGGRFDPMYVLYGHEARVWSTLSIGRRHVSVGEDGAVCLWDTDSGCLIRKWKGQRGGIRTTSYCLSTTSLFCGSDSGCVFSISLAPAEYGGSGSVSTKGRIMTSSQMDDDVTAVYFAGEGTSWITVTNRGTVAVLVNGEQASLLASDRSLRYSTGHRIGGRVALGGLDGRVHLLDCSCGRTCNQSQPVEGKVFSVHLLGTNAEWLLICSANGMLSLWSVKDKACASSPSSLFQLPPGKQRWLESALLAFDISSSHIDYLVVGDRNGGVYFYCLAAQGQADDEGKIRDPSQSFPKVHGNKEVTDLLLDRENGCSLHSIGRDGCWRQWRHDDGDARGKWRIVSCAKLCSHFEWPSRFVRHGQGLLIAGFRSNKFVLYDPDNNQYLGEIECGGGHRSYDLQLFENSNGLWCARLLFTKKGRACEVTQPMDSITNIELPLHVRRITDVAVIAPPGSSDEDDFTIATCSEDTMIALWTLSEGKLRLVQRLKGHISSVHCLCTSGSWLMSGGGRCEICWWGPENSTNKYRLMYRHKNDDEDVRCLGLQTFTRPEAAYVVTIFSDGRLSIYAQLLANGVHRRPVEIARLCGHCCLTRIRLLHIDAHTLICTIGTNGRLYVANDAFLANVAQTKEIFPDVPEDSNEEDWDSSNYGEEDLSIYAKSMRNRDRKRLITKKRAERCRTLEYELDEYATSVLVENAGLTALDVKLVNEDANLIMCSVGSESGALFVILLQVSPNKPVQFMSQLRFPDWHVSTVTGLTLANDNYLVSNGIDQRIALWKYKFESGQFEVCFHRALFSHVADPANITLVSPRNDHAVICGSGIQIVDLGMDDNTST